MFFFLILLNNIHFFTFPSSVLVLIDKLGKMQDVYKSVKIEILPYEDDLDMVAIKLTFVHNQENAVQFLILYYDLILLDFSIENIFHNQLFLVNNFNCCHIELYYFFY
jgi:hypothetical protein